MNIKANESQLLEEGLTETDGLIIIAPDIIGEKISTRLINEHKEYLQKYNDDCDEISFDDALYYIDDVALEDVRGAILQSISNNIEEKNLYLM